MVVTKATNDQSFRLLSDQEPEWIGDVTVRVIGLGPNVWLQVWNGGDFGNSEMELSPAEARTLAEALLTAAQASDNK